MAGVMRRWYKRYTPKRQLAIKYILKVFAGQGTVSPAVARAHYSIADQVQNESGSQKENWKTHYWREVARKKAL